jgi:hypothetical protein
MPIWRFVSAMLQGDVGDIVGDIAFIRQAKLLVGCVREEAVELPSPAGLRTALSAVKIPNEFFDFGRPEFGGFPMEVCGRALGMCLLTGEAVTTDDEAVWRHASEKCGGLTVVLQLTGEMASATMLITTTFRKAVKLRTVFLDKFGDEDIGIRVGNPLTFRNEAYGRVVEMALSGEWITLLNSETMVGCRRVSRDSDDTQELVVDD